MALEVIEAKTGEKDPIKVEYEIPGTIQECVALWGEEAVHSRFKAALVIDIQAMMRGYLKDTEKLWSVEEIQADISAWKPGVKAKGKPVSDKVRELFAKLSPEERAALLESIGMD